MKYASFLRALGLTVVLALAGTAFAGNSGTLKLADNCDLNGTKVAAGEYKVQWDANGDVTLSQGKKVVAKTHATISNQSSAAARNTVETRTAADGSSKVVSIQLENSKSQLIFEGSNTTAEKR